MTINRLELYYEHDSARFWDPRTGMTGRDLDVYPLLSGCSGTVLEYGCGCGSLLLGLARESRFSHCVGVDLSERALEMVRRGWDDIAPSQRDKLTLLRPESDLIPQVATASQDVVISVATVEHVIDPYVVLDELHRVASPDAVLVCSVPNYAYLKHRITLLFGGQPRTGTDEPVSTWRTEGWDGMHLHTFTKSSFTTLLEDCGWQPVRWMGAGERFNSLGVGYLRRRFPGVWSGELIALCRKASRRTGEP
jgi:SAM-dependent methyltransferase